MSKKNYGSYFKGDTELKTPQVPVLEQESVEPEVVEEPVVEEVPVEEVIEPTPEPVAPVESTPTIGVVINCSKLNIRKKPDPNAEVITKVEVATEFVVDMSKSTLDWVHVCTASGIEGYCMKKFVAIV